MCLDVVFCVIMCLDVEEFGHGTSGEQEICTSGQETSQEIGTKNKKSWPTTNSQEAEASIEAEVAEIFTRFAELDLREVIVTLNGLEKHFNPETIRKLDRLARFYGYEAIDPALA